MVCGCDPRVAAWFKKNAAGWTSNIAVLVVLAPFVMKRAPELRAIFELATPVALAFIFFATINGRGLLASAAKVDMIRRVGLVSYSLYLWQQVFAGRPETYDAPSPLAYWGLLFPVAWLSYVVIEQTGVRIGRRLSARITARAEQTASGPAAKTA